MIMLAIPVLLVVGLEGALRILNYGQDLSLFTTRTVNGTTYYLLNHQVKARYFPNVSFAQTTSLDCFTIPKPKGHFRIFILGGSTAAGYPYGPNASFASFLRQRLNTIFPQREVEVINLGMTATNSFTVLDLARELPAYEPDLLIVYDGHNEFYGGLGVNSQGLWGGSRLLSLLYLKLIHVKVFLLARDAYGAISAFFHKEPGKSPRDVTMELLGEGKFVPYGSPLYLEAKESFRANLQDLKAITLRHNIPLILSTQVSNLRGQPPFASGDTVTLSPAAVEAFNAHRSAGKEAWEQHRWSDALSEYRVADSIVNTYAGVHFAIARCLDVLGDRVEARREYIAARDDDELRFRTSSDFNRLIGDMDDGRSVGVVDMERLFMSVSPDSLIGNELILEHLHPNAAGYFLMAKGYAKEMRRMGLLVSASEWTQRDTMSDLSLWGARTVTELDERTAIERTARMTSGWPFAERSLSVPPSLPRDTLEAMATKVIDGEWGNGNAHQECARYYEAKEDWRNAEREYKTIISLDALKSSSYINLARFYLQMKRLSDASLILRASLAIEPTGIAYSMLGDVANEAGDYAGAVTDYQQALPFMSNPEEQTSVWYNLALAELRLKHINRAREALRSAIAASPQHEPSLQLLRELQGPQ